jgi:hypothetical protein
MIRRFIYNRLFKTIPTVTTSPVIDITNTGATSGGIVRSDGGLSVTERGICWSTTVNPTILDDKYSNGEGLGSYIGYLTGLTSDITYYVRAYATNSKGTGYGSSRSFIAGTKGFITEWTVSGDATARTITLPLYNDGVFNCTVDWGDGSPISPITSYNDSDRIHTYSSNGIYEVEIKGSCPSWSFNNSGDKLKITKIIYWGNSGGFDGFKYLFNGFYGCSNLTSLGKGKILNGGITNFSWVFFNCTSLTSIPNSLFDDLINITQIANTFYYCSGLLSIPDGLFSNNINLQDCGGIFAGCTGLTSIPKDLFRYNINLLKLNTIFNNCKSLISIPEDLFKYNINVSDYAFSYCFAGCTSLTSIPNDLFRYNTNASSYAFEDCFLGCTSLISIPNNLFRYNTLVSYRGFMNTFHSCTSLETVPNYLFRYNTNVSTEGFGYTFYECNKLQINPWIFYADGEQNTRFLNKISNFKSCFQKTSITGNQGTAPDLWNCNFGTQTPVSTLCFRGNNITSLSNYDSIPAAWK